MMTLIAPPSMRVPVRLIFFSMPIIPLYPQVHSQPRRNFEKRERFS